MRLNITGRFAFHEDLYSYIMLISQIFGTSLNIFTLWVIYKYSTSEMKSFKVHLIVYQLASMALDFGMDFLARPIFFFPYVAGTSLGWLRTVFGLNSYTCWSLMTTYVGYCMQILSFQLLYYRWQMILPESHCLKFRTTFTRGLYVMSIAIVANFEYPIFFLYGWKDEKVVQKAFKEQHPVDANLASVDGFYYVDMKTEKWFTVGMYVLAFWTTYLIFAGIALTISCYSTLNALRSHMSEVTRKMHFRFLRNLCVQITIPIFFLQFPVLGWLVMILTEPNFKGQQDLTNFLVWCASNHGIVGSFFLLFLNKCYREAIMKLLFKVLRKLGLKSEASVNVSIENVNSSSISIR